MFSFTTTPLKVILSQIQKIQIQQQELFMPHKPMQAQGIVLIHSIIIVSTLIYKIRYQNFIAMPRRVLPKQPKVKKSFQYSENKEYKLIVQTIAIFLTTVLILFTVIR